MSHTTESARDEYHEWESFLSPRSYGTSSLTPIRLKTRVKKPLRPSSGYKCLSTQETNEGFNFSPPLKDIVDIPVQFDEPNVWLSPLPVLHEDYFLEEQLSSNTNAMSMNLNNPWTRLDFTSRIDNNRREYYDLYSDADRPPCSIRLHATGDPGHDEALFRKILKTKYP